MRTWRVLSTAGLVVAIGGCAATVVAFAAAQPRDKHDSAASPSPTPSSSYADEAAPTLAVPSSASVTHPAARSKTTASSTRPAPSAARTSPPSAPAPTTKAAPPAKPVSNPPAAPRGQSLPLGYGTGSATRVITVVASSTGSTTATLQAWNKAAGGGWLRYGSAVTAHVGSQGLTTQPSETKSATPIGSYTLTQAFGALADPGTNLPYFKTDTNDWWISQSGSLYNTHQHCASGCPFIRGDPNEHLRAITPQYNYAVVIDYNRSRPAKPGAGSAFFLHVTDGSATAGCVAISQSKLVTLMKWLTPSAHPRILIGVA